MTKRYEFTKSTADNPVDIEPGTWASHRNHIFFACPSCEKLGTLQRRGEGHEIDDDGNVDPSVLCTPDRCGWHAFVHLRGWDNQYQTTPETTDG